MRTAVLNGRLQLVMAEGYVDVARASGGRWGPLPEEALERWASFRDWASSVSPGAVDGHLDGVPGAPVPRPRQVFAVALNYAEHAAEGGREVPTAPLIFTKFVSCLAGAHDDVVLPTANVDFEAELVVVIGSLCRSVSEDAAWGHVAGLMPGQDLSERVIQRAGSPPQFSLGKSFPGFGPIGPYLVTIDEVPDPDDLELGCSIAGGEVLQAGRTSQMIFAVPELVSRLSRICPLLPGDLIFTGTPAGVGAARQPPRFLEAGEELITYVAGVGEMRNRLVAPPPESSSDHGLSGALTAGN